MSEPSLAAQQAAYLEAKSRAPYGFLREPLSATVQGYEPDPTGAGQGRFNELRESIRFGEWQDAPELESDEDYRALKTIHGAARQTWRGIVGLIEQVQADKDPTLNNDAKLKILGRVIEPKLEELAGATQRELSRVDGALAALREQMEQAQREADPVGVAVHAEIRAHWKANADAPDIRLAKAQLRMGAELGDGSGIDTQTLQALATGPAYLSGLTPAQHDRAKALLAERLTPSLVAKASALQRGREAAEKAVAGLEGLVHRTVDMDRARKLREMAKDHG